MNERKLVNNYLTHTHTQKGVTLITLAVTIIVMLILAGVTISTLIGKSGITSRATEARDKNAIAKVEEEAQIEYSDLLMNNQIDSIGEDITIGNIKERLERKGYEIKTIGSSDSNVIGIELSENNILLKAGESKEVRIIYKYSEGTALKYYIKIKEYYHEIKLENGKVKISEEKMNGQDEMENDIIVQIGISPIVKGIKAVQDGSKIKITADSNVDAGNKVTIKARYGDSTNQTCDVVITKDIHWEEISEQSYVGYYADIDGDGVPDGIIFADMLYGKEVSGYSSYTIPTISGTRNYKISQENYVDKVGGTNKIITPSGDGADRFYVMALTDIQPGTGFDWYNGAKDTGITYTYKYLSSDFGSGKENTRKLIEKWNAKEYGEQNTCTYGHKDIWGQIQTEVNRGWFVPSSGEWNAFSDEIGIWNGNYSSRGMSPIYWSSYCYNIKNGNVGFRDFTANWMYSSGSVYCDGTTGKYNDCFYVRLAMIF